ncbi:MAG: type II secretion system F family protein [Gaiellaceae bacterium]
MILILIAGLFLAGASVTLAARALAMPRARTAETLAQIDDYGYAGPRATESRQGPLSGALDNLAHRAGSWVAKRFGSLREEKLRDQLMAAGIYGLTPRKFVGYRLLSTFSVPTLWLWSASTAGYPALLTLLGLLLCVGVGWMGPIMIVKRRAQRRLEQVDYELPELIDLLVVTVEAGLGFNGSLQVASERLRGPLGDELRLAMQEQTMGLTTSEALSNMLTRCQTPLMRSFVRGVLQGETLGVSIGKIMRDLATDMRKRRRQAAEERAQKAPVKILFPLVFLIFPAMFVVLLGPAVYAFTESFGG